MFDSSRHQHTRWIQGNKFHRVPDVISPKSRIAAQDHRILNPQLNFTHRQTRRLILKIPVRRNEFEENAVVHIEQHAFHLRCILVGQEPLRRRVQFHPRNVKSQQLSKARLVRSKRDTSMHKQRQVGKDLLHGALARVFQQTLEIHLHPRWDSTDESQIFGACLSNHRIHLRLPILDAIGFPRRQAVGLQVRWHVVCNDAAQPPQVHPSSCLCQFRTALKKDHFAVHK